MTLERWDDVFHVWQAYADLLPEARDAIAQIGAYIDQRLRRPDEEHRERSAVRGPVPPPARRGGGRRHRRRAQHQRPRRSTRSPQSGLNHLQVPKELGGLEADVDTTLDVLEELAHQDGSIGWVFMANANATAMCSMFDPDVARPMLEGRPEVVCAGQFVSRGKAGADRRRLPGPRTVPVRQRDLPRDLGRRWRARARRRRRRSSATTPGCRRSWPSSCRRTPSRSPATGM